METTPLLVATVRDSARGDGNENSEDKQIPVPLTTLLQTHHTSAEDS